MTPRVKLEFQNGKIPPPSSTLLKTFYHGITLSSQHTHFMCYVMQWCHDLISLTQFAVGLITNRYIKKRSKLY